MLRYLYSRVKSQRRVLGSGAASGSNFYFLCRVDFVRSRIEFLKNIVVTSCNAGRGVGSRVLCQLCHGLCRKRFTYGTKLGGGERSKVEGKCSKLLFLLDRYIHIKKKK